MHLALAEGQKSRAEWPSISWGHEGLLKSEYDICFRILNISFQQKGSIWHMHAWERLYLENCGFNPASNCKRLACPKIALGTVQSGDD